jgi:hypothetical protein
MTSSNSVSVFPSSYPSYVYNFAYGSNMCSDVLTGRRKIKPVESIPGVLEGWQLTFDLRGVPGVEPAFGNIKPNPTAEIHGLLHKMTGEEFKYLLTTEGGGGERDTGYIPTLLPVLAYDGRVIQAYALVVRQNSPAIHQQHHLPSNRYLNLLVRGAKHHGVEESYIEYLESLPFHTKSKPVLALMIFELLLLLLLYAPIYLPVLVFWIATGKFRKFRPWLFQLLSTSIWALYTLFGCASFKPYDCAAFPINSTHFKKKFNEYKDKTINSSGNNTGTDNTENNDGRSKDRDVKRRTASHGSN